jgi:hypothetical protein
MVAVVSSTSKGRVAAVPSASVSDGSVEGTSSLRARTSGVGSFTVRVPAILGPSPACVGCDAIGGRDDGRGRGGVARGIRGTGADASSVDGGGVTGGGSLPASLAPGSVTVSSNDGSS